MGPLDLLIWTLERARPGGCQARRPTCRPGRYRSLEPGGGARIEQPVIHVGRLWRAGQLAGGLIGGELERTTYMI